MATVLAAGCICGLLAVVMAIGNATLLAHGALGNALPAMIGVALLTAAILPIATAFSSGIAGQITSTQEISVIALQAAIAAAAGAYAGNLAGHPFLATILTVIGLTTALCGIAMVLLGTVRLGRIIRFVPFPVFGGFLAITGWYLLVGGLETTLGHGPSPETIASIIEPSRLFKLALGIVFVVVVRVFDHRIRSGLLLPAALVVAILGFNIVVAVLGLSQAELQHQGWVFAVPEAGVSWPPIGWHDLADIDWRAVASGLLFAPFVIVVTAAGAMMNVSGIEIELKGDVDLDRELRSMGWGNFVNGLLGGIPGFPGVSATMLAARLNAADRWTGFIAGFVGFVALLFAGHLLRIVPAPLLGAVLMLLGVELLIDWVIKPFRTLRRREHAIILVILLVSIAAGFAAGIITGLLAALVLFVFEYSRVEGVQFIASGRDYQSPMLTAEHRAALALRGDAVVILKLSGFIFFGTSDRIVKHIANRVANGSLEPVRFVVVDFRRVAGIDSSTIMSFDRLKRLAGRQGFTVILSSLSEDIEGRLSRGGLDLARAPFEIEPDLDSAVRMAEGHLLADTPIDAATPGTEAVTLSYFMGTGAHAESIRPYLTRIEVEAGARMIEQGARSDDMFFIESGAGLVMLEAEGKPPLRLMSFGGGAILGEVAFYRREPRSASVVAETNLTAWRLSREALGRFEHEQPSLAASFHAGIARTLADRLQGANRMIRIMAD